MSLHKNSLSSDNTFNLIDGPKSPFVDEDDFVGRLSSFSSSPHGRPSKTYEIVVSPTQSRMDALSRLNIGAFLQWMLCFCVVDFDLEIGQAMEVVYPPIPFSPEESKTICFSAFPDSNSTEHLGDSIFSFRMRNSAMTTQLYKKEIFPKFTQVDTQSDTATMNNMPQSNIPSSASVTQNHPGLPIDTDGYTYGYVFFRQKRDAEVRRGFFQKSLVILSPYPWTGFFSYLLSILGPQVMDTLVADRRSAQNGVQNIALFETASFNISSWPSPPSLLSPDVHFSSTTMQIHFLGHVKTFSFPPHCRFPQLYDKVPSSSNDRRTSSSSASISGLTLLCNPPKLYQVFSRSVEHLWFCWELMMIGAPLLVMADTPQSASETVWSLIELIKPIPFGGDFRPYFTIQDTDFSGLASSSRQPAQGTLLGVTNMVFSKLLDNWPNVMRISRASVQASNSTISPYHPLSSNVLGQLYNPPSASARNTIRTTLEDSFFLQIEKFASKHKSFFVKDKKLMKDILEAAMTGMNPEAANNMIRRHFVELTERFLQPLNRYFETLVIGNPSLMNLSCLRSKPDIKAFHQDRFLKMIEQNAPSLPLATKRPITEFYKLFLMSPNFALWIQHKTTEVYRGWRQTYLNILCNSDVTEYITTKLAEKEEVECIDLYLRLREELDKYSAYFVVDGDTVRYANLPGNPPNEIPSTENPSRSRSASATKPSSPVAPQLASFHLARNDRASSLGGIDLSSLRIANSPEKGPLPKERSMTPPPSMTVGSSPGPSPLRVPLSRARYSTDSSSTTTSVSSISNTFTDSLGSRSTSHAGSANTSNVSSPSRINTSFIPTQTSRPGTPSSASLASRMSNSHQKAIPNSRSANSLLLSGNGKPALDYPVPLPVSPAGSVPSLGAFIPSTTHYLRMKEQLDAVKAALPPELKVTMPFK